MLHRMAGGRLESCHGTGAAAWKRAEQQAESHSGAGVVARGGSHALVQEGAAGAARTDAVCNVSCSAFGMLDGSLNAARTLHESA